MAAPLKSQDVWTEARVEHLKERWIAGDSCGQIAAALGEGVTRNAVLGKVTRLKLPRRLDTTRSQATRAARHPNAIQRRPGDTGGGQYRRAMLAQAIANGDEPTIEVDTRTMTGPAWEPLPSAMPISLIDLTVHTCRWPIGDAPILFCGAGVAVVGKPYCATHSARSRGLS